MADLPDAKGDARSPTLARRADPVDALPTPDRRPDVEVDAPRPWPVRPRRPVRGLPLGWSGHRDLADRSAAAAEEQAADRRWLLAPAIARSRSPAW
jgi:hypothetical protein